MGRAPARGRQARDAPALLTPAAYARRRGVTKQAVAAAISTGRIPTVRRAGRRMVDPTVADAAWTENTDPSKPLGRRGHLNGHAAPAPGTVAAETLLLTEVRRKREEFALARESGLFVEAAAVERRAFDQARAAQKALLSIPARLPLTEAQRKMLRLELLRVCAQLADEPPAELEAVPQPEARAVARS